MHKLHKGAAKSESHRYEIQIINVLLLTLGFDWDFMPSHRTWTTVTFYWILDLETGRFGKSIHTTMYPCSVLSMYTPVSTCMCSDVVSTVQCTDLSLFPDSTPSQDLHNTSLGENSIPDLPHYTLLKCNWDIAIGFTFHMLLKIKQKPSHWITKVYRSIYAQYAYA